MIKVSACVNITSLHPHHISQHTSMRISLKEILVSALFTFNELMPTTERASDGHLVSVVQIATSG